MAMKRSTVLSRHLQQSACAGKWSVKGIDYRLLERSFDPEVLFKFNKEFGELRSFGNPCTLRLIRFFSGSTPHNFIPDGPVKEHLGKVKSGETLVKTVPPFCISYEFLIFLVYFPRTIQVWAAFEGNTLVGFITGEAGGGYWSETGPGKDATWFIHEFVVNPNYRGKSIGSNLTKLSIDSKEVSSSLSRVSFFSSLKMPFCVPQGIFGIDPTCREMYTTVHSGNIGSRTAFIKGGYHEVITYEDDMRKRATTVLKAPRPDGAVQTKQF